jgi:hypothetical protein
MQASTNKFEEPDLRYKLTGGLKDRRATVIETLMYDKLGTRPVIGLAASIYRRHLANPINEYQRAVGNIFFKLRDHEI